MRTGLVPKRGLGLLLLSFVFLFTASAAAFAGGVPPNQELSDLKAQVRALTKRIKQLEAQQRTAPCPDTAALQQKVQELEKWKKDRSNFKVFWKNGFRIKYHNPKNNNEYLMRLRAGIQMRYTYVSVDDDVYGATENFSSFTMRRLRLFVDGYAPNKDWKYFMHIQLEPQGKVHTHDAFIVWRKYKYARIQFGRMKIPYSIEYWQSGFGQNGADRTIFTGDSEMDKDKFGNRTYDIPGYNARLRVGSHLDKTTEFPTGGMLLYRSQGFNINGDLDLFNQKQFLVYWAGIYNGRDTQATANFDDQMLYVGRIGINFLPGSDPKGPMGPKAFKHYFAQGDYGYNTTPLAALIFGVFDWKNKVKNVYDPHQFDPKGKNGVLAKKVGFAHDINNYGGDVALLFRYLGFSADLEAGWEEFQQAPDKNNQYSYNWDRWGARANLGYFLVPKKWEVTVKYAYMKRLDQNNLENSLASGLGLVRMSDDGGYAVEKDMHQVRAGINYYLHGFNQYISAEVGLFHRNFYEISQDEADALGFTGKLAKDPKDQDDVRFRIQYQHFF